jgi:hypothetical protein
VLAPAPLGDEERWNWAQTLAVALGRDVDLVDLRRASTVMRLQVIDSGKLLFESDVARRREFETIVLSDYAPERRASRSSLRHSRTRQRLWMT